MTDELFERSGALGAVGHTPLLELRRLTRHAGRLLAKAEYLQPGGSVKDRSALGCLEWGYRSGSLTPGQRVVEMTSGNMGAGLAVACAVIGHPFTAYMSRGNSPQRAEQMRELGATVVLVDQVDGLAGQVTGRDITAAAERAQQEAHASGAWYVDQFANPGSVAIHAHTTGPEIWAQADGKVDAFVAAVGTGGTLVGTSSYLRSVSLDIRCVAVEPATSRVLAGQQIERAAHMLQGCGYGSVPAHWDAAFGFLCEGVTDAEATDWRRRLAVEEGVHVGFTAAANVCVAARLMESGLLGDEPTVVTVLCDSGMKYPARLT
jgi:cysteine synthase A